MTKPIPDAPAPALKIETVGGGTWTLADQTPETFTMVVFYRGHHCPVCKGYLKQLDGMVGEFAEAGAPVVAVSMNPADLAAQSKDQWELPNLTVGYGLSEADARAWGLYISTAIKEAEADMSCEPGLFLVRPDGRLYMVSISNMPWARPSLDGFPAKLKFAVDNNYPARGTA